MKNHIITVGLVLLCIIAFALGSVEGGLVFIGLALWIECSAAYRFYRKYKLPRKTERHE